MTIRPVRMRKCLFLIQFLARRLARRGRLVQRLTSSGNAAMLGRMPHRARSCTIEADRRFPVRVAAALLVLTAASASGALAQATSTRSGLPSIGLCQCIADRTDLHLFCTAGGERCQAACASTVYSFVPLTSEVIKQCSPKEVYVVLPNADGRPGSGAITVQRANSTGLLDQPYAAAAAIGGATGSLPLAQSEVDSVFGKATQARPRVSMRRH